MNRNESDERDLQQLFEEACRIALEHGKFALSWIGTLEGEKRAFPEVLEREPPRLPSAPPQQKDESERKEGPPRRGERR